MTQYLLCVVPVDNRDAFDKCCDGEPAKDKPQLVRSKTSPGASMLGVPLSARGSLPATHYGMCCAIADSDGLNGAIETVKTETSGCNYHLVAWEEFDREKHWIDWLAGIGLAPIDKASSK